jgi:hypothetical protein
MPTDYQCNQCALKFSVGPYHYHSMEAGYAGCRLLFCRACGTQHGLEAALRDRGTEFHFRCSVSADDVPLSARKKVAQWLRLDRKVTPNEALELARRPPFFLASLAWEHQVDRIRSELEPLGVVLSVQQVEKILNPVFGPVLQDRLRFCDGPAHGEKRNEWHAMEIGTYVRDEILVCQHCKASGTLTWEFAEGEACPSCEVEGISVAAAWIT